MGFGTLGSYKWRVTSLAKTKGRPKLRRLRKAYLLLLLLIIILAVLSRPAATLGPSDIESADTELIAVADTMVGDGAAHDHNWGDKPWMAVGPHEEYAEYYNFIC